METIYLCIIIFLFVLAVFDLIVGVSNDAVNFLNSAVGAKAASFKTILFIAGIGIFIGASLSNGMMDIARHGIYQPEHFYFAEIMCILLAVMLTDVVLLDVFNSMGMPTSTTVSLVFELLGGTFALSLIKVNNDATLALGDLINTDKALSVIMAIFVSVAIAFFFGMLVQWLARIVFTFNYTKNIKYSIGLFGGIAATSIIYFMLIKGLKDSSFMTPENKQWIQDNTLLLIASFFVFFTALMQVLHWLKVNVFKVVVLMGTFALALAFAGNDLVNFMTSGPVMIQVLEGEDAIAKNRQLMGATDPKKAEKGTIRADFAESIDANAVHGSDAPETAAVEVAYFFPTLAICSR